MKFIKNEGELPSLDKPFFVAMKRENSTVYFINERNDLQGDLQFEWDLDGSQRKAWNERMKTLEQEGTLGDLVLTKLEMVNSPLDEVFTAVSPVSPPSFEFKIINLSE